MASAESTLTLAVTLVWAAAPHQVQQEALTLPAGSTVAQALRASTVVRGIPPALLDTLALAIWDRACTPDSALRDGDRLALLRPLVVDPKEARRQRYQRDGLRKPVRPARQRGAA